MTYVEAAIVFARKTGIGKEFSSKEVWREMSVLTRTPMLDSSATRVLRMLRKRGFVFSCVNRASSTYVFERIAEKENGNGGIV